MNYIYTRNLTRVMISMTPRLLGYQLLIEKLSPGLKQNGIVKPFLVPLPH